ncbi:DUF982 domain-containing protein [Rhizobium binxianense]
MPDVIEVDFQIQWNAPVYVRVIDGTRERINGPDEAVHCLTRRWWGGMTPCYIEAKERCVGALCKRSSVELARSCFISAAAEAGVLS